MMLRRIIRIDEAACNGCGACASACHEGAIEMINGKAHLTREDYCDGLGDCLPACPANAISFEEREAPAYDEAAVLAAKAKKQAQPCGCPGAKAEVIAGQQAAPAAPAASRLSQWPVQLKLAPITAPYLDGAHLLIAADCTAYAYGNFHEDFIAGRITLIGCPKLDAADYAQKLAALIANNDIKSVTVVRMQVPCCSALEQAVRRAVQAAGKALPCQSVILSTDGRILGDSAYCAGSRHAVK